MTLNDRYSFRPVTMGDLDLLQFWQSTPHVRQWWDSEAPFDAKRLADLRVRRWIVSLDEKPFGYIQDYAVHGWPEHHFDGLPVGTRGIDQYIGAADMLGHGHGQAFIHQHMKTLFNTGAPMVATDPHPNNERAIAVYTKLGFKASGPPQDTPWGKILPMIARA